jgi:ABC-type multidrug transport system ATPase subunit
METLIRAENLTKDFCAGSGARGIDAQAHTAVLNLNLEVRHGEILALLGPNGAGKTTTVRMLSSILKPTRGRAQIAGFDVEDEARRVCALVGHLTKFPGLCLRMNARDNLDFYGELYGMAPAFGIFEGNEAKVSAELHLHYRTDKPHLMNPGLIQKLNEAGAEIVTMSQTEQSLEQVYLKLMQEDVVG